MTNKGGRPTADKAIKINITVPRMILRQIDREAFRRRMSRSEYLRLAAIQFMDAHP